MENYSCYFIKSFTIPICNVYLGYPFKMGLFSNNFTYRLHIIMQYCDLRQHSVKMVIKIAL